MKNEIRQAVRLPLDLEDKTFDMQGEAFELFQNGKKQEAVNKIWEAWHLLPEPKFNTSCSLSILGDLVDLLTATGKHEDAQRILKQWADDVETSGYKIYETTPFILLGQTYLYLHKIELAKEQFYKSAKYGATKRDFSDLPSFYFDIAKKKLTDNNEIEKLFQQEVIEKSKEVHLQKELSDEISDKIEELAEKGNNYYDKEDFLSAIKVWKQALGLIHQPQNSYAESQWLEASIGDAYFLLNDFKSALSYLENAKGNIEVNAYENPLIMIRLGQVYLENQQPNEAKEYLLRAYMLEGEELFEEEDAKYFDFLKQNVKLQ